MPSTPTPTPTTSGTLAVIGDSFVVGQHDGLPYVEQMAPLLGVTTAAYGINGTGFLNPGGGGTYDSRLAAVLATKPVGLVVQASVNDRDEAADAVANAATTLISHARTIDPGLPITIVGPIFLDEQNEPRMLAHRAALAATSAKLGVTYIDPTGWITDATKAQYISSDGLHPSPAGYTRIATQLAEALEPFAATLP